MTAIAIAHTTTEGGQPLSAPKKRINQSSLPPCVASVLPGLSLVFKTVATLSLLIVRASGGCATDGAAAATAGGRRDILSSNVPATAAAAAASAAFAPTFRGDFDGRRRHPPPHLPDATTQRTAKRTTTCALQRSPQLHWFRASGRVFRNKTRTTTPPRALLWQACRAEDRRPLDTATTTKLVRCAGLCVSEVDGRDGAVRDRHAELVQQWGPAAVVRFEGVTKKYEQRR